jgi:hypothetical protein
MALGACTMQVETRPFSYLQGYDFHLETRVMRDGSYMWDSSQDTGEIWAVNRGDQTVCVSLDFGDGYPNRSTIAPHQTMRLYSGSHYTVQSSVTTSLTGHCA